MIKEKQLNLRSQIRIKKCSSSDDSDTDKERPKNPDEIFDSMSRTIRANMGGDETKEQNQPKES